MLRRSLWRCASVLSICLAASAGEYRFSGPYTHDNLTIFLIHGGPVQDSKTIRFPLTKAHVVSAAAPAPAPITAPKPPGDRSERRSETCSRLHAPDSPVVRQVAIGGMVAPDLRRSSLRT